MSAVTVFACGRSRLHAAQVPDGVRLVEVPCTGRVTSAVLLASLAQGSDGVLVLGRHQQTCRLNGAEDRTRSDASRVAELLQMLGLDGSRVQFAVPAPGTAGPLAAVEQFQAGLAPIRERSGAAPTSAREGLDTSLELLRWLSGQPWACPSGSAWLAKRGVVEATAGKAALLAGPVPYLAILGDQLFHPLSFVRVLQSGLLALGACGEGQCGAFVGGYLAVHPSDKRALAGFAARYCLTEKDAAPYRAAGEKVVSLDQLLAERASSLPRAAQSAKIACHGAAQAKLVELLGHTPVDVGPDPLPETFGISPDHRKAAELRLEKAEREGAPLLLADSGLSLARWALITRHGTWRSSRVAPVLAHQIAALSLTGKEVAS